jgi:SNF2 family DNA or RNA helicase
MNPQLLTNSKLSKPDYSSADYSQGYTDAFRAVRNDISDLRHWVMYSDKADVMALLDRIEHIVYNRIGDTERRLYEALQIKEAGESRSSESDAPERGADH